MSTPYEAFKDPEYGPAPESTDVVEDWLEGGAREFGHFIGGCWTEAEGPARPTSCPADGQPLATVHDGSPEEVDRAVKAAAAAFPEWQALGGHHRARHLYRIARQIQKRSRHFAVLESLDNGKPIRESRDLDIPLVARHFYHHAGWAQLLEHEFPDHEALGVVGQIIPWNFPLLMLAWKVAPALAAGNTVVLKPAEHTPLTALYFAEVLAEAGLPAGVVNIVTGAGATGEALVAHPDVAKIAFTGSTDVGRRIREQTAGSGKKLSLELGGKSPIVVFDSADLDGAVEGVVDGIWFNQGQVCCAGSRLLVQESIESVFMDRLKARMETLRMGHPLDKSVDMGAIITERQLQRIRHYVEIGAEDGGQVWQPSWWRPDQQSENGPSLFFPPTLCTGVSPGSRIATDEVFGPVIVGMTFRTPAEAVSLANDTRYGLAASVWTEDINLALDVAPKIKAGTVWVNCTNLFDGASGFGGYRESGFGREGGREGMWEYLRPRTRPKATSWTSAKHAGLVTTNAGGADSTGIDRTRKLYIGGKQRRPDGGHALVVGDAKGRPYSEIPRGNRKDVRNAVEAARKAQSGWQMTSGHLRSQI
ncbi:MAG: aldehyde dehydrogenase family protein, partial [Longimicrobiales bacterium]